MDDSRRWLWAPVGTVALAVLGNVISSCVVDPAARASLGLRTLPWMPVPLWAAFLMTSCAVAVAYRLASRCEPEIDSRPSPLGVEIEVNRRMGRMLRQADARARAEIDRAIRDHPAAGQLEVLMQCCRVAEILFEDNERLYYPMLNAASSRMRDEYISSSPKPRESAREEFESAFIAGREYKPISSKGRSRIVWMSGVWGQLILDYALISRLTVRAPLDVLELSKANPGRELVDLYMEWFERAKDQESMRLSADFADMRTTESTAFLESLLSGEDLGDVPD